MSDIFSCNHPIENEEFQNLYLLYDPTYHLRTTGNNLQTEKNATAVIYRSNNK